MTKVTGIGNISPETGPITPTHPLIAGLSRGLGGGRYPYTPNSAMSRLPTVTDPEQSAADMTRRMFDSYVRDFEPFERELIERARTDTSLIDRARTDAKMSSDLSRGIANRNVSRYGGSLTPAQLREQKRGLDRGEVLTANQSVNDARLAQRDLNQSLLAGLIDIGQGVRQSSEGGLMDAAASQSARQNAYRQAKAQNKANTISGIGSLVGLGLGVFGI